MECDLRYELAGAGASEAKASLEADAIALEPAQGPAFRLALREIVGVRGLDYRIELETAAPGGKLTLSALGYSYEDFLRELVHTCHELEIEDRLAREHLLRAGVRAACTWEGAGGTTASGPCELRLYDTALLVLPDHASLLKLPYREITGQRTEGYQLIVETESGGRLGLQELGYEFEPFRDALRGAMNTLALRTQEILAGLAPGGNSAAVQKAAWLMRDGRAVSRGELEAACPGLWDQLEQRLAAAGAGEVYAFLNGRGQTAAARIGIKRGLMGDKTGEYIWFMIPLPGDNAAAMEAVSTEGDEGAGKATYFFRLLGQAEFRAAADPSAAAGKAASSALDEIGRDLVEINFRREPIYLPETRFTEPRYQRYAFALRKLAELRRLRWRFLGRVMHLSPEQWQRDALALLTWQAGQMRDGEVWRAGEGEEP